jgi:hypothetical protein
MLHVWKVLLPCCCIIHRWEWGQWVLLDITKSCLDTLPICHCCRNTMFQLKYICYLARFVAELCILNDFFVLLAHPTRVWASRFRSSCILLSCYNHFIFWCICNCQKKWRNSVLPFFCYIFGCVFLLNKCNIIFHRKNGRIRIAIKTLNLAWFQCQEHWLSFSHLLVAMLDLCQSDPFKQYFELAPIQQRFYMSGVSTILQPQMIFHQIIYL